MDDKNREIMRKMAEIAAQDMKKEREKYQERMKETREKAKKEKQSNSKGGFSR